MKYVSSKIRAFHAQNQREDRREEESCEVKKYVCKVCLATDLTPNDLDRVDISYVPARPVSNSNSTGDNIIWRL